MAKQKKGDYTITPEKTTVKMVISEDHENVKEFLNSLIGWIKIEQGELDTMNHQEDMGKDVAYEGIVKKLQPIVDYLNGKDEE